MASVPRGQRVDLLSEARLPIDVIMTRWSLSGVGRGDALYMIGLINHSSGLSGEGLAG